MPLRLIVDSHVHSHYSPDSKIIARDGVLSALSRGLGGIAFTDHYEFDYPRNDFAFYFDARERSLFLDALQNEFENKIKILKGLELGYRPHCLQQAGQLVGAHDFDFIIGSVHVIDNIDAGDNSFHKDKTNQQACRRYLEEIYNAVQQMDCFDVIGHIGYVRRYLVSKDRSLRYCDYADLLDAILKKAIDKDKGIEVNTSGCYHKDLCTPIPDYDVLARYKQLGGRIVTIGSDSHQLQNIGHSFTQVLDRLKAVGFNYVAYFEKRQPHFVKI
jgi:histidinol-phosphatase (PHP family)